MINDTFLTPPRADLEKPEFDKLILQKGREVILEKALQCPCKSASTNQQSNCRNCGGTGWVFINPKSTRMVLTAIDAVTEYRPWSEELRGTVNVTAFMEDQLSQMDRITIVDGESIHSEVLFLKNKGTTNFVLTTYNVEEIDYIALFDAVDKPLIRLNPSQYTIDRNFIIFNITTFPFADIVQNNITIRYKHFPQYHVIEMKREHMQSFRYTNTEVMQDMPVSAIARRAHYQLSGENLNKDRLIDNSYKEPKCQ